MDASVSRGPVFCFALFIGALLIGFIAFNAAPLWLSVDILTDADDTAQVFYSPHGAWSEEQSVLDPVHPALTRTLLRLPGFLQWTETVRFDPGRRAATYRILGVRWFRGFLNCDIPLDTVASGRDGMPITLRDGQLELIATDTDPQLIIPMPGFGWQAASLLWPTGIVILGVAGLWVAVWRRRIGLLAMANICVAIAAIFYCVTLTQHGAHLPLYDDWRYMSLTSFDLFEGGGRWMRMVGNDTYFLTGQVLDFVTLWLTHGNFEILRLVALGLLLLQVGLTLRVLARVTGAVTPWLAAPAIVLVAWSLSSNSYWGSAVIAYHQFLPVLCGTLLLVPLIGADGQLRTRFNHVAIVLLCFASGLAYISGGLITLCLGLGFLLAQADVVRRDWRAPMLRGARLIVGWGATLLALQLTLVTIQQGSLLDHTHATQSVLPTDHRFWLFAYAQFGRALGYNGVSPLVDAGLTLLALFPTAVIAGERIAFGFLRGVPAQRPAMSALALYAGIAAIAYAAVVALGRAGFGAPDAPVAAMIELAKSRFHYWPVAALMPFLWLGWIDLALRWRDRLPRAAIAMAALVMLAPKSSRDWDLLEFMRFPVTTTARGGYCIATHLQENPRAPFDCLDMTGTPMNLSPVMQKLHERDSVLYRQLERFEHTPLP